MYVCDQKVNERQEAILVCIQYIEMFVRVRVSMCWRIEVEIGFASSFCYYH